MPHVACLCSSRFQTLTEFVRDRKILFLVGHDRLKKEKESLQVIDDAWYKNIGDNAQKGN